MPLAVNPVDARVTQGFGRTPFARTHLSWYRNNGIHRGIDYASYYQPVVAPVRGEVTHAGPGVTAAWGWYIDILETNTPHRLHSILHLKEKSLLVNDGDIVQQGAPIATSGNTGLGTAPHTHWEVESIGGPWRGPTVTGNTVDPRVLLYPELFTRDALEHYAMMTAKRVGMPTEIFIKQINQESGFNPFAASSASAHGIAQIVPKWHPNVNPWEPYEALDYAATLMKGHFNEFGTWRLALAAYNAGPTAVRQYGGIPPFAETQNYVHAIMGAYGERAEDLVEFGDITESQAIDRWLHLEFQDLASFNQGVVNRAQAGTKPTDAEVKHGNERFNELVTKWPELWAEEKKR